MKKYFEIKKKNFIVPLILSLWALCFYGCMTEKKASNYFDNHSFQGANYCETRYPSDTSEFKPGKVTTTIDTQYVYDSGVVIKFPSWRMKDSIIEMDTTSFSALNNKATKTSNRIITINKIKVDTVFVLDKAKYKQMQGENLALQQTIQDLKILNAKKDVQIEDLKKGRNTWRWIGLIFIAIFLSGSATFVLTKFRV